MNVKWTPEQEKAVYGEKANCLVSAAAGSGKTQVLTGRIIERVIREKLDINRILVVTFTNAAAAEMRARITSSISEALAKEPENEHIAAQLSLMGSASIMTMHSFCLYILRTHFAEAGIDSAFRVADATETVLMRTEAAQKALEEMLLSNDADFISFANCYAGVKNDALLCDVCMELYAFAESMPHPKEWLSNIARLYDVDDESFGDSLYAKIILESVKNELESAVSKCERAAIEHAASAAFCEVFEKEKVMICGLLKAVSKWDSFLSAADEIVWPRRRADKGYALADDADALRKSIKKQVESACNKIIFTQKECAESLRKASGHINALCRMVDTFEKLYTAMKREKDILDYSDLEHLTISLLSDENGNPSDVACALRERYDEIYIDEYQDSNDVQEYLFGLIARERVGEPNLFMVGDMKQSIYGFRKTSPELFIQKSDTYAEKGPNKRIILSKNFRSRPEILDFINAVFKKLMHAAVGGIDYTENQMLYPGASFPPVQEPCITFSIVDTDAGALNRVWEEAYQIAEQIKKQINSQVYDEKKGEWRQARYSDIAVIMRSAKEMAIPLQNACAQMGIPLYCDVGGGYFETIEVSVFLSLLTVIDNPQNDIPLLATLRAPFFSFSEDELAQIRMRDKKRTFYHAVKKTAEEDSVLGKKCLAFLNKLKRWRRHALFISTDALILQLFEETGYLQYVSGSAGGERSRSNLEILFDKAHQFEKTSFRGLFHFLRFMERAKTRSGDFGEAKMVSENDNVVRLMTIHKSKGLEFPIVILAGTGKSFNRKSTVGNFLFHKDLGIGIRYIDPELKIRYSTPAHTAVMTKIHIDEMGEELRVLYVALTRAKEKLIITGAVQMKQQQKAWDGGLTPTDILHADSFLTLLGRSMALGTVPDKRVYLEIVAPYSEDENRIQKVPFIPDALPPDAEIDRILSYQYPHKGLRYIPVKISVTEYKRLLETENEDALQLYKTTTLNEPRFCGMEGNVRGASFGTLMHFIMQNLPIRETESEADVKAFIQHLKDEKIISELQAEAVDTGAITRFMKSDIGVRLRKADAIMREEPFALALPASMLTQNEAHKNEKIIVQGIIDCYFFEGDKITLLDYKTDRNVLPQTIIKRYKPQIDIYAMALRQKYFSEIYEKVIYLFSNNDIIVLP